MTVLRMALLGGLLAPVALAQEGAGGVSPALTAEVAALPEEPTATPARAASPKDPLDQPELALPRETAIENPLGRATPTAGTAIGGYGEITLNAPSNGPAIVDLRRFVLYFGHDFTDQLRFYSEVEAEHALASSVDRGEFEIEQAYLDWLPSRRLNVRFGLLLMPMGIINIYHEPPSFFGVDRPDVDLYVIPTTWREPGFGIFGELSEALRYQLYVVDGFNAQGFSALAGVRNGVQESSLAFASDVGAIARLDYEPKLGTVLGASAYGGVSGPGAEATGLPPLLASGVTSASLPSSVGLVPVGLFDVDARTRLGGFSARLELALLLIGDTQGLSQVLLAENGGAFAGPVSSVSFGGYVEAGYDLLRLWAPSSSQGLILFSRLDSVNTQADVPVGFSWVAAGRRYSGMVGLVYKPIPQIALKADLRRQEIAGVEGYDQFDSAITWLF